eukprot:scaffold28117_cov56-Attheya_sp.AAC.15
MKSFTAVLANAALLVVFFSTNSCYSFVTPRTDVTPLRKLSKLRAFGGGAAKIPSSPDDRDNQAIKAVKAAISSPRNPSLPVVECEFPPLKALNKLGDGSLRSATEAEQNNQDCIFDRNYVYVINRQANLAFAVKLLKSISPLPFMGPKTWLLTSSSASQSFMASAKSKSKGTGAALHSLRDGLPKTSKGDVCVLVTPSSSADYNAAERIASTGDVSGVVILNGFAKDTRSVPSGATMAYFYKALTYNSQVAGYLIRSYPGKWTTLDATTKQVLSLVDDDEILVRGTNTPDLRSAGKLVQMSVDQRAIRARRS